MNQPHLYIHSLPFGLPTHSSHHRALSRVPCAIQYVLIAREARSCLTLCDPVDLGLPGSSVTGMLQARILEWVAIS